MTDMTGASVAETLRQRCLLDRLPIPTGAEIVALPGHASTRRYFRVLGTRRKYILAVYPEGAHDALKRYLRASDWFAAAGVRVPRVEATNERAILLDDIGDSLLVEVPPGPERMRLYRQAMTVLARVARHGRATEPPNADWRLDATRLRRELAFAEEHAIGTWMGGGGDRATRDRAFDRLAQLVGSMPRVICHRDYHARNLMVRDERLTVIDFQDVMWGPVFYDAASLLWDNYCDLDPRVVAKLLSRSHADSPVRGLAPVDGLAIPEHPQGLPPAARQAFALVAAQRHIKALGTFGYQVTVAGNVAFARFGKRTRGHVRAALRGLGWHELEETLSPFDRLSA